MHVTPLKRARWYIFRESLWRHSPLLRKVWWAAIDRVEKYKLGRAGQ